MRASLPDPNKIGMEIQSEMVVPMIAGRLNGVGVGWGMDVILSVLLLIFVVEKVVMVSCLKFGLLALVLFKFMADDDDDDVVQSEIIWNE